MAMSLLYMCRCPTCLKQNPNECDCPNCNPHLYYRCGSCREVATRSGFPLHTCPKTPRVCSNEVLCRKDIPRS